MAIKGFSESRLVDSEIFNGLREIGDDPIERAIKLIKNARVLTKDDIEGAYVSIKQYSDGIFKAALKSFDEDDIILIYNDDRDLSMSQAFPFLTFKRHDGWKTYVFTDKYIQESRDKVLSIQAPILRDLLVGALIANRLKSNYEQLSTNPYLQKSFMEVYTKFVIHILNQRFMIKSERVIMDIVQYYINKFFLTVVFKSLDTPENIETLSSRHFRVIDEMKYEEIKNAYNEAQPMKVSELLEIIKPLSPRMVTLDLHSFLEGWISYFYPPATLAIDNMEYLIFMVMTILHGNNIISIAASDMVKDVKDIKILKQELLKII